MQSFFKGGGGGLIDSAKLKKVIKKSGFKKSYIAAKMEITRASLYNKINNMSEFTVSEMQVLSKILNCTEKEREEIFFKNYVDNLKTRKGDRYGG